MLDEESIHKQNESPNNSAILSNFKIKGNAKLPEIKIARRPSTKPTDKLPPIKEIKNEKPSKPKTVKGPVKNSKLS